MARSARYLDRTPPGEPVTPEEITRQAEQSLLLGHPFHPTPKSAEGISDDDLERFAPELGASFRLHYWAVAPELLVEVRGLRHLAEDREQRIERGHRILQDDGDPAPADPARLALTVVAYSAVTLAGLLLFGGLPVRDRWRLLDVIERSWEGDPALPQNLDQRTAEDWLAERKQSERARAEVWTPLARFLIGDDLATVSAAVFVGALTRCFLSARRHARLALPADTLHTLLVAPLADRLARAGATIRLNTVAAQLQIERDRVTGVKLRDNPIYSAFFKALGASAHNLPATEVYSALEKNVVGGNVPYMLPPCTPPPSTKWCEPQPWSDPSPFEVSVRPKSEAVKSVTSFCTLSCTSHW